LLGQAPDGARANVLPRLASGLSAHHTACPAFYFAGPCGLDLCGVLGGRLIETGQEFRRDIGPLVERQRQDLSKKFLRARRHDAILHLDVQPNTALHPTPSASLARRNRRG
jgi:hypothetical protein